MPTQMGRLIGSESREAMDKNKYELIDSARALLFGKLLDEALPYVQMFRSDLYRDALWMNEHLTGNMNIFYFGYRSHGGTSIGFDKELVSINNEVVIEVHLFLNRTSEWSGDWEYLFHFVKVAEKV